jgi:type III pantothenate kinase
MAWLLVDNSNTRTKFALGDADQLLPWRGVIPTADLTAPALAGLLEGVAYEAVLVASVVPTTAAVLAEYFRARCPLHRVDCHSPLGLGIDYPLPEQIGADRLVNAAGVLARHGAPAIVVDFGTAVTFDVVSAEPAFCGGVIAPGLGAVTGYLSQRTALLPQIDLEEPATAIGKSTEHAMRAGAVFGYRGLVRGILAKLREEMDGQPRVVATGGDAALVAAGLPEIDVVDPDLTLDGLRRIACRAFS